MLKCCKAYVVPILIGVVLRNFRSPPLWLRGFLLATNNFGEPQNMSIKGFDSINSDLEVLNQDACTSA